MMSDHLEHQSGRRGSKPKRNQTFLFLSIATNPALPSLNARGPTAMQVLAQGELSCMEASNSAWCREDPFAQVRARAGSGLLPGLQPAPPVV